MKKKKALQSEWQPSLLSRDLSVYELFQSKVAKINTLETAAINPEVMMTAR